MLTFVQIHHSIVTEWQNKSAEYYLQFSFLLSLLTLVFFEDFSDKNTKGGSKANKKQTEQTQQRRKEVSDSCASRRAHTRTYMTEPQRNSISLSALADGSIAQIEQRVDFTDEHHDVRRHSAAFPPPSQQLAKSSSGHPTHDDNEQGVVVDNIGITPPLVVSPHSSLKKNIEETLWLPHRTPLQLLQEPQDSTTTTQYAASSGSLLTRTTLVPNGLERLASFEVCGPACQARRAMESLNNSFFSGSSAMKALQQCVSSTPKPPSHKHIQTLVDVSRRQHDQTTVADSLMGQNTWLVAQLQKRLKTAPEEHVIAKVMMVTHDLLVHGSPEFAHALAPVAESYFDPDSLIALVPHGGARDDHHHHSIIEINIYEHTTRFFIAYVHALLQFQLRHRSELNLLDPHATDAFLQPSVVEGVEFWSPNIREIVLSCLTLAKFIIAANTVSPIERYCYVFTEVIKRYLSATKQLYRVATRAIHLKLQETRVSMAHPVEEIRKTMACIREYIRLTAKLNDFYDSLRALPAFVLEEGGVDAAGKKISLHQPPQPHQFTSGEVVVVAHSGSSWIPEPLTLFPAHIHASMRHQLKNIEELQAMGTDTLELVLSNNSFSPTPLLPPDDDQQQQQHHHILTDRHPVVQNEVGVELQSSSLTRDSPLAAANRTASRHNGNVMNETIKLISSDTSNASSSRFTVLQEHVLGKGGFGVVYKAWDEEEGRHVACKEVKVGASGDRATQELYKEYRVLTTLEHPNIVKVLGFVVHQGHGRIFMEWVPSGSVQSVMQETKKGIREQIVRRYIREALQGLAYLHSRGIVHRDVKPGNMLLASDGSVKLTDFGTSRALEVGGETMQTGTVVGTVPYLAPECVRGTYSAASDVWAIGCTALHMITGKAPWVDEVRDNIGLIFKIGNLTELPKSLNQPDIPLEVREFITNAMRIERHDRPTAEELLQRSAWLNAV